MSFSNITIRPATSEEVAQLKKFGLWQADKLEGSIPQNLLLERAYLAYFSDEENGLDADQIYDIWVDYTDSLNVDFDTFERIDMALSLA